MIIKCYKYNNLFVYVACNNCFLFKYIFIAHARPIFIEHTQTLHIMRNLMIVARQMLLLSAGGKSKAYLFNLVVPIDH